LDDRINATISMMREIMIRLSILLPFLFLLFIPGFAYTETLPQDMQVLSAEPGVFKVIQSVDAIISYPAVALKQSLIHSPLYESSSIVEQEAEQAGARDKAGFCWDKVLSEPEKYLEATPKTITGAYGLAGSAFAVSNEGVLLTNAHVVADPTKEKILFTFYEIWLRQALDTISDALHGGPPTKFDKEEIANDLYTWYMSHGEASGKVNQTVVAINFGKMNLQELIESSSSSADILQKMLTAGPIMIPVKVRAIGEVYPGKDVAVIQMSETVKDKLICLPLGDSDLVVRGSTIHALGFPGGAFSKEVMKPEAEFVVSAQPGEVVNKKPMIGDWDAFEMTAGINHGDSGGPVIDKNGNVIALNVAGTNIPEHNLAVPINLAKTLLNQAGIHPDPGSLSTHWMSGLNLFSQGQYAAAEKEFQKIIDLQGGPGSKWASPYVTDMLRLCEKAGH
jgi:S1-C subfamily serine protease